MKKDQTPINQLSAKQAFNKSYTNLHKLNQTFEQNKDLIDYTFKQGLLEQYAKHGEQPMREVDFNEYMLNAERCSGKPADNQAVSTKLSHNHNFYGTGYAGDETTILYHTFKDKTDGKYKLTGIITNKFDENNDLQKRFFVFETPIQIERKDPNHFEINFAKHCALKQLHFDYAYYIKQD